MFKEAEIYYRSILSEPLDERTFKQTLQKIYELENAASLITENFMTILNNPNINVFRFIFDDFFCNLFSDAIKKNISIVLRMIVKSGNPVLLDRLENHYRGLLLPKA
ncbi:MAG TPA: hypothetical protein DCY94_05405, partial [Firmicutes bacterium]|nr:hypothetical protein [Bacillota bacterium]